MKQIKEMKNKFLLHEHKTDINIHKWCYARSSGISRTILYPYQPESMTLLQDKDQVLEIGEVPIFDMMGTNYKDQLVYTLLTTRYLTSLIGANVKKHRIEGITLKKTISDILFESKVSTEQKICIKNYAKTADGEDFDFFTESGFYQMMIYQIFHDLNFMCSKYRVKYIDEISSNSIITDE